MRKSAIIILFVLSACVLNAAGISNAFFISSKFKRDAFSALANVYGRLSLGAEASYTRHDFFDDGNFFFALPVVMSYDPVQIVLRPFGMPQTNYSYAYGGNVDILVNLEQDTVGDKYSRARLSAGYVNQRAVLARAGGIDREDYGQLVYSLGLRKNFYNSFVFGANAEIFEYVDGIKDVRGIRGIFNQNDFADLNSYDVVYDLPKYSVGAVFNRIMAKGANIYLSYSYTEFYTADHEHSVILGNDFPVSKAVKADLGYNHIIFGNNSKKDIFKIALKVVF